MKHKICGFITVFIAWIVVFMLQKPLFMLACSSSLESFSVADVFQVMFHGLHLDQSMAGYLTAIPALLLLASVWTSSRLISHLWKGYFCFAAILVALAFCLNVGLYPYWGFPLDSTPLFYFISSPADAMASVTGGMMIAGFVGFLVIAAAIFFLFTNRFFLQFLHTDSAKSHVLRNNIISTCVLIVFTALLIIPIRGGVSVSSTNTGKAYFSEKMTLNHAAVNPMFSLIESLSHENDFASQYRFMEDAEADKLFKGLVYTSSSDSVKLLNTANPDVYFVVLEGFSTLMMNTGSTPNLVSLSKDGVYFNHFYANSFRTDRGLLSILSGYPAQPTMSLMKYPQKTNRLPSIANKLQQKGYDLKYYYGGDADFTNMRSYLTSQGFTQIISDVDFPVKERLSKWGVPDGPVVDRLIKDLKQEKTDAPLLRVLQTSSSHEPFDVPWKKLPNGIFNAFNYTDAQVGRFVDWLKKSGRWERSLVILVPDHLGCWPEHISNFRIDRYEIPMVWIGGAISGHRVISTIGSQHDIAATLLGQMGIKHDDMLFSKDMLDAKSPHFAFFAVPDAFGMVTENNQLVFDNKMQRVVVDEGKNKQKNLKIGQAYLQKLYDDIANR